MTIKISIDLGILESKGLKVNGIKNFVHEEMQQSKVRVLRVKYIVKRICENEVLEPFAGRFISYLKDALAKADDTGDSSVVDEGMTRQAEALFLSFQPKFDLSDEDKKKIHEMCEANGIEIPKEG